ncbi:unnamed protein product [Lactuca virosa]|uniref:Uncharacterized protein n=1 Tax=Lactuca virosa TaxID=75947 RepID=A0AAU9MBL5_9ASTR|nr:unnamed protein product [Lactuca virosa]
MCPLVCRGSYLPQSNTIVQPSSSSHIHITLQSSNYTFITRIFHNHFLPRSRNEKTLSSYNMHNHRCIQVGLVIIVLLSLLVSGAENGREPIGISRNVQPEKQQKQQNQQQGLGDLYSSKRRVPNASDPLHNR